MSDDKNRTVEYMVLRCGRTVPAWLYKWVFRHVLKQAGGLEACRPYTLKMICRDPYWSRLGKYRTSAGLIMAELVDLERVPYTFAGERTDKPLWYRLKP